MEQQLEPADVVTARIFRLKDESGQTRAMLTTLDEGRPSLLLFDDQGQSRIEIGLQADGAPRLVLNCEDNITLVVEIGQDRETVLQVLKNGRRAGFRLDQVMPV